MRTVPLYFCVLNKTYVRNFCFCTIKCKSWCNVLLEDFRERTIPNTYDTVCEAIS